MVPKIFGKFLKLGEHPNDSFQMIALGHRKIVTVQPCKHENRLRRRVEFIFFCSGMLLGNAVALAGDAAQLVSVSITNGTPMLSRTVFTQTWTMKNTGTTTWTRAR